VIPVQRDRAESVSRTPSRSGWGPCPRQHGLNSSHAPRLPDFDWARRIGIGEFWSYPESRAFAELLIVCEEDRTLRAVLVGTLREADR
jgi:hypothetical protein